MSRRQLVRDFLLLGAFLFVALVGGTDAGRYLTPLRAVTAAIGACLICVWIVRARRNSDRVDQLVLGALLLFLVSCVAADYQRQSFEAATTALAFCGAVFIARGVVFARQECDLALTALALCGLVVAAAFTVLWGGIWIRWFEESGGQLPPFDLILPVGPFRQYHVVGMTVALLLPAQFVIARRPGLWPLAVLGTVLSLAVVVMSGSRTVWLAVVVAGALTVALMIGRGRWHLSPRVWLFASAALVFLVAVLAVGFGAPLAARLFGSSTIGLRGALWDATLARWSVDPLFGSGPGSFSSDLTVGGFFSAYDGIGRHADNAVIQVLAEGGLFGLASIGSLCLALAAGTRRTGVRPAPMAALVIFAVASLTDNPSDSAHLVVIAILWFALAVPRPAVAMAEPGPRGRLTPVALWGAAVIGLASVAILVGSWMYDQARPARLAGDEGAVVKWLTAATRLDPSFALYQRDLGLASLANQDLAEADLHLARAAALNPGDITALRIRSLTALLRQDTKRAGALAAQAVRLGGERVRNSLFQAWVAVASGDEGLTSNQALVHAVQRAPWLPAASGWQDAFGSTNVTAILGKALDAWLATGDETGRHVTARTWLAGMQSVDAPPDAEGATTATHDILRCDVNSAETRIAKFSASQRASVSGLVARLMAERATGQDDSATIVLIQLRWPLLGYMASSEVPPASPLVDQEEDTRIYGRLTMPAPDFGPLLPSDDGGLSAWLHDPRGAARVGAPMSGLATCSD